MSQEDDRLMEQLAERRALRDAAREQEEERWRLRMLFVRNVLNCLFMLMAAVTMLGIWLARSASVRTVFYYLGVMAVVLKMAEVMMRVMKKPWSKKQ